MDTIIVQGTKSNDNGSVTKIGKSRVDTALDLYLNKRAKRIVFSGGYTNPNAKFSEAENMRKYALECGVSDNDIILEERARETIGNAHFTKINFLESNKWYKNIAVSSKWHLPRLNFIFDRVLGDDYFTQYVGSDDKLTFQELKKVKRAENLWYMLDRLLLLGISPGNDEIISKRLSVFYSLLNITEKPISLFSILHNQQHKAQAEPV